MKTFSLAMSGLVAALVLSGQDLRGQSNNVFYLNIAPVSSNALLTWTNTGVVFVRLPLRGSNIHREHWRPPGMQLHLAGKSAQPR
jgi:hypothetical protein